MSDEISGRQILKIVEELYLDVSSLMSAMLSNLEVMDARTDEEVLATSDGEIEFLKGYRAGLSDVVEAINRSAHKIKELYPDE